MGTTPAPPPPPHSSPSTPPPSQRVRTCPYAPRKARLQEVMEVINYGDDTIPYEANVLLSQATLSQDEDDEDTLVLSQGDTLLLSLGEEDSMIVNVGSQERDLSIPYDMYTSSDMFEDMVFSREGDELISNFCLS